MQIPGKWTSSGRILRSTKRLGVASVFHLGLYRCGELRFISRDPANKPVPICPVWTDSEGLEGKSSVLYSLTMSQPFGVTWEWIGTDKLTWKDALSR